MPRSTRVSRALAAVGKLRSQTVLSWLTLLSGRLVPWGFIQESQYLMLNIANALFCLKCEAAKCFAITFLPVATLAPLLRLT
jgi:hypothetical protein